MELASRVISALVKNSRRVRGKLTLHFAQPQTQTAADEAADRCAQIAEALLGEADDHEQLIGAEADLVLTLRGRLPSSVPPLRSLDVAALHVVGDPGTSAALRRASTTSMRAVTGVGTQPPSPSALPSMGSPVSASPTSLRAMSGPPSTSPPSAMRAPNSVPSPSGNFRPRNSPSTPPLGGPVSGGPSTGRTSVPSRRGTLGRMRAVTPDMLPPIGSPPDVIGNAMAPFVRDCAGRVLVGFLRAYDLLTLRGLALEEESAEMLAALVPVSDAPLGGYEASRSAELGRWQTAFGDAIFQRLRRESQVVSIYLAHTSLGRFGVPQNVAFEILQEAAPAAFAGERGTVLEMGRYMPVVEEDLVPTLCNHLVEVVGHGDASELAAALAPLVASVQEDMAFAGRLAKEATGL
ncbi:hypothetical protein [Polyangium aurulentum]|uniref:hypothetical protein n=1 Tax=Polyangium aurulentum TaxID=2567896 RepID=UPI0010AE58E7|nr:hypothetical protein [Polyangium aurulentum]UQA63416.1 hypothetical protein E8A73_024270 [Polyangium aurulentum]